MNTEQSTYERWQEQLTNISSMLIDLEKDFVALAESGEDLNKLADGIIGIHALKADISVVYDGACKIMIEKMGDIPEINLDGGHKVEKKSGADRKSWNHPELAKHVAGRINDMAVDMDTGEIVMTPQDMMIKMFEFAAVSYWRVKELSKIGISADDFCEVGEAKTNIIVRKAK
jgi:hypothetical protein